MGGIKYYRLAMGEEMPDEFCAVRDIGGEPGEYVFYVPEAENVKLLEDRREYQATIDSLVDECAEHKADNAKLRELVREVWTYAEQELVCDWTCSYGATCDWKDCVFRRRMRELGVEVGM